MTVFTKARIKLTIWYSLVIFLISSTLSLLFFHRVSLLLDFQFVRIERRLEHEQIMLSSSLIQGNINRPPPPKINPEDIIETKKKIAFQLILINLGVSAGFTLISYFFASKTLRPIQIAHQEQKRFVADAAHELRTPVTALKTSLEVNLLNKKLPKQTQKILQENLEDVINLEKLTVSLLKLAQDSRLTNISQVSLNKIIKQAIKQTAHLFTEKNIKVSAKNMVSEVLVLGNETQLIELFTIILDNARKYSHKNSKVTIQISPNAKNNDFLNTSHKKTVQIDIIDHGIGMDQNQLQQIFKRFYRADNSRTKSSTEGYGLGLALAKRIIQKHRGKIEVVSQPNFGSTFSVTLNKAS